MSLSQPVLTAPPSKSTMRNLTRELRREELREKSWQSNRGNSWCKPATAILRYGLMKSSRFTVGSIVLYKRSGCLSAAVLTSLRQRWDSPLKPSHEHAFGNGRYAVTANPSDQQASGLEGSYVFSLQKS